MSDDLTASLSDALIRPPALTTTPPEDQVAGPPDASPWRVESDTAATWALRRIAQAQATIDEAAALAQDQHAIVNDWHESVVAGPSRTIAYMTAKLYDYLRARMAADPTGKTRRLNLPGGVVSARKSTKIVADDEAALLDWLRGDGAAHAAEWLKVTAVPRLGEIKSALNPDAEPVAGDGPSVWPTMDGEPVPGVRLVSQDNFSVEPAPLPGQ